MYRDYFKLREYPFSLTPDTDFWFDTATHMDAINVLRATLRSGDGFVKITAEVGLGKTLLCRKLLRELDGQFHTAYIPDPQLSSLGLRRSLAEELGIAAPMNRPGDELLRNIRKRLLSLAEEGTRVVLIIDEAHQLPDATLEGLRLLTNLETEKFKLLQVVIVGQPELDRRLNQPRMRQLKQRISFACTLSSMSKAVAAEYIAHRLRVAECGSDLRFTESAVRQLCTASRGAPRVINVLCHKALMVAYGRGEQLITDEHVIRAINDTESAIQPETIKGPLAMLRGLFALPPNKALDLGELHGVRR